MPLENSITQSLSDEERDIMESGIFNLLALLAKKYTSKESSSIPVDTAQEMLNSIHYLIESYLYSAGYSQITALDMMELYNRSLKHIESKIEYGKKLYSLARLTAPKLDNISISDTLNGIGTFFKYYDYKYFAHLIPGDIDYQLCIPVSEDVLGIDYINAYLQRFITENSFIWHFDMDKTKIILGKIYSDYCETILNLYEPVFSCALGLAVIGKDIFSLTINGDDLDVLYGVFSQLDKNGIKNAVITGSKSLHTALGMDAEKYFIASALQICPRIDTALRNSTLENVFITCK